MFSRAVPITSLRRITNTITNSSVSHSQVIVPISIKEAGGTTDVAKPISTVSGTTEVSTVANTKMVSSGPTMAEVSTQ